MGKTEGNSSNVKIEEDVWIRSSCGLCYSACAIKVRRINGVAVKIEGDPESPFSGQGGICGKGASGIQMLYDPNRLAFPMKRTNPEKGIGVDPQWERISWDEALEEITARMKKIRNENPNKFGFIVGPGTATSAEAGMLNNMFNQAFGSKSYYIGGAGLHCGSASHLGAGMNHCSWSILPDYEYCNYFIHFGATKGTGAGHSAVTATRTSAQARERGAKMVVFDPVGTGVGGKADEWIPILPGTDLAVALAMGNVLLNELNIYDAEYLKFKTNAAYLVKADGTYVRDENDEPLLWDLSDEKAKPWNDSGLAEPALEGNYEVNGEKCRPVLPIIKEHIQQYSPEWASEISTVPAATIRRIATEFGSNAKIGSTIEIEGLNLPYRPVAAFMFRGGQGHSNGFHAYQAIDFLNHIVGSSDVPGGVLGWPPRGLGYPPTGIPKYEPEASKDGFLRSGLWPPFAPGTWPHNKPQMPERLDIMDVFTCASFSMLPYVKERDDIWQKLDLDYRLEMIFVHGCNPVMSIMNPDVVADWLQSIPFIVDFNIYPSETSEGFADMVLPDCCYLEKLYWADAEAYYFSQNPGMGDWGCHLRQPVVEPLYERRNFQDVLAVLAENLGFTAEYHAFFNYYFQLKGAKEPPLEPDKFLTHEEKTDRFLRTNYGPDKGLDWFKKNGFVTWKKRAEEAYWRPLIDARSSIYHEYLIEQGKDVRSICEPRGVPVDYDQYVPLLSYFPTVVDKSSDPSCDLIIMSCRDTLHSGTTTQEIPYLAEATGVNPYTHKMVMHIDTATDKALKAGDTIWIENDRGTRIKAQLQTTRLIHPKVVNVSAYGGGHWAKGLPIAKSIGGPAFNYLLPAEWGYNCPITLNIETCVKGKVYKA